MHEKYQELEEILKEKWCLSEDKPQSVGLFNAAISFLNGQHYVDWLKRYHPHFKGLEHSFIIYENGDSYLIIRNKPTQFLELRNKEQIGIIDHLMKFNPKSMSWMFNNSASFVKLIYKTTISKENDRFRVFKNLDKRIEELIYQDQLN